MLWALIAGWIGGCTFVGRLVPQAVRLRRHRDPSGVSWLGSVNVAVGSLGWAIYGFGVGSVVLWLPSLVALVPALVTAWLISSRPPTRRDGLIAAVWLAAILLAWPVGGRAALAVLIGVDVFVTCVPHVASALMAKRVDGISPHAWRVALADAALWGTFSVGTGEPMTGLYAAILGTSALIILWRVRSQPVAAQPAVAD